MSIVFEITTDSPYLNQLTRRRTICFCIFIMLFENQAFSCLIVMLQEILRNIFSPIPPP